MGLLGYAFGPIQQTQTGSLYLGKGSIFRLKGSRRF